MSNPLVNKSSQQQMQQPDLNKLYQQFQQAPLNYLKGLNIPQGMTDPKQIVIHLANNGKVPPFLQGRVNAMLGRK